MNQWVILSWKACHTGTFHAYGVAAGMGLPVRRICVPTDDVERLDVGAAAPPHLACKHCQRWIEHPRNRRRIAADLTKKT